jgi:hypothetical protein
MKLNLAPKLKVLCVVEFPHRRLWWWWRKISGGFKRHKEQKEQEV